MNHPYTVVGYWRDADPVIVAVFEDHLTDVGRETTVSHDSFVHWVQGRDALDAELAALRLMEKPK